MTYYDLQITITKIHSHHAHSLYPVWRNPSQLVQLNGWCFRPHFCTCKAVYTGPGTTWAYEMDFVMNHARVQDWLLDLLTSSPTRYHCITDVPFTTGTKTEHQSELSTSKSAQITLWFLVITKSDETIYRFIILLFQNPSHCLTL